LQWFARVLLLPEGNERRFQPVPDRAEPVDARVAGGTKGNEQTPAVDAGTAVMDSQLIGIPTALAAAAVALQNFFPMPGKAAAGVCLPPIAGPAQSGTKEAGLAARTEKPGLPTAQRSVARR
jgi:hypothetical protein